MADQIADLKRAMDESAERVSQQLRKLRQDMANGFEEQGSCLREMQGALARMRSRLDDGSRSLARRAAG